MSEETPNREEAPPEAPPAAPLAPEGSVEVTSGAPAPTNGAAPPSPWAAHGESKKPRAESGTRRLTTFLNSASAIVLAAATCVVLLAATPSLIRTFLSRGRSVSVSADADHLMPHRQVEERPRAHRGFERAPADYDPRRSIDEAPDQEAAPRWPFESEPDEGAVPGASQGGSSKSIRLGLARRALKLHAEPDDNGTVLGEIKAGEQVVIIKEAGLWALVFQSGNMGWTRKSEIAVR